MWLIIQKRYTEEFLKYKFSLLNYRSIIVSLSSICSPLADINIVHCRIKHRLVLVCVQYYSSPSSPTTKIVVCSIINHNRNRIVNIAQTASAYIYIYICILYVWLIIINSNKDEDGRPIYLNVVISKPYKRNNTM